MKKTPYSVRVRPEDGRATSTAEQHALGRDAIRDLRQKVAPPMRETLAGAIKRHGGPASVMEQYGMERGPAKGPDGKKSEQRKKYDNALRMVQRHATEGKEQRGKSRMSEAAQKIYDKVLGKDTVERIKNGGKGGTAGPLPRRGAVHMVVSGEISVSEDVRDRAVNFDMQPADFADLTGDPIGTWLDMFKTVASSVRLNDVEWIELSWEDEA